ncbi:radical SAM protein [Burkholderia sp. Bp9142]|uniref:B12-binding domain-containing radical SAM protein n=1 Tax=Burkholderia sp. Bp9142 TaxID=2184573 RepID=UPI000F59A96B|nr:radical SAM protein [Burkholderia sp. Bp9142]RQR40630.1 radical SAM protein [Burkholderia sp. Bp9142]
MARILLINLASLPMPGNVPIFPIGVRCIQDALRVEGHDVELMDFVERPGALRDLGWVNQEWDIIGLSIRNIDPIDLACDGHVREYEQFVEMVRGARTSALPLLVAGGPGYSLFAPSLLERLDLDVGIAGPGETTMIEIARNPRRFIGARTVMRGDRYAGFVSRVLCHPDSLMRAYSNSQDSMIGVETRRKTCFQRCVYCPYAYISGDNAGDEKPIELLAREIESIHAAGFRQIFFTDSIFNSQPSAKGVVRMLADSRFDGLAWSAYFSPMPFDDEFAELLAGSGVESIVISPDSLDERMMRLLGKNFNLAAVRRVISRCRAHSLRLRVNIVFGGPGETRESVANTARFANELLDADELSIHVGYRILPRTSLATRTRLAERDLLNPTFYPFDENLVRWIIEDMDARFLSPTVMMNLLAGRASARRMVKLLPPEASVNALEKFPYLALSRQGG